MGIPICDHGELLLVSAKENWAGWTNAWFCKRHTCTVCTDNCKKKKKRGKCQVLNAQATRQLYSLFVRIYHLLVRTELSWCWIWSDRAPLFSNMYIKFPSYYQPCYIAFGVFLPFQKIVVLVLSFLWFVFLLFASVMWWLNPSLEQGTVVL